MTLENKAKQRGGAYTDGLGYELCLNCTKEGMHSATSLKPSSTLAECVSRMRLLTCTSTSAFLSTHARPSP
jgi:hypothetical protein